MNDTLWIVVWLIIFAVQLLLCAKGKKLFVRLLPLALIAAAMIGCVAAYILSGYTNWAFLILLMLLGVLLTAPASAWLLWGLIKLLKKAENNSQV